MRLTCSVQVLNRLAVVNGQNGALKPLKGIVQLRKIPGGLVQILVSTSKDVNGQRYNVANIQNLRTKFISDGMITIEMKEPPINLMIRNCKPEELVGFHNNLIDFMKTGVKTNVENQLPSENVEEPLSQQSTCSRNNLGINRGIKRSYDVMSISKIEVSAIKKTLRMPTCHSIVVGDRKNYPKEFPPLIESVNIRSCKLKKIDPRILMLSNLSHLSLSCNCITSIEPLRRLKSNLVKLVLSSNDIEVIPDDLFLAKPFTNLMSLHLNENKLKTLPSSILQLKKLSTLDVSRNQLHVLPYNLNKLKSLLTLKVNANRLDFIPVTVCSLRLEDLDISDNCFTNVNADDTLQARVEFSPFPTLFELAAEKIATRNFNWNQSNHIFIPEETPKILVDYLNACKCCFRCSRMSLRYSIYSLNVLNRDGARSTTNSPGFMSFASKKIICSNCINT